MSQVRLILERQWLHGVFLVALLAALALASGLDLMKAGILWGISTRGVVLPRGRVCHRASGICLVLLENTTA